MVDFDETATRGRRSMAKSLTGKEREFADAVDAFMPLQKALAGSAALSWQQGRDPGERRLKIPIEVGGEQRGQYFVVMAYPDHHNLMFRIGLQFHQKVVCRLDYELDATHGNKLMPGDANGLIHGPHWHSWEINRHCVSSVLHYDRLPNAVPFTDARRFDSALRWYCAKRLIGLGQHGIEWPPRERLL